MADEDLPPPIRLMNFVSEEQLEEARRSRGSRVDDGTAQRDRSLYEILKENKDRKDAEFNERFKHRPPKALDEEETDFLDKLETSRREYERQMADEEAQQLQRFQAAVAAQGNIVHKLKEMPPVPKVQDEKLSRRKNPSFHPLGMVIKVKPQAKKAKRDVAGSDETASAAKTLDWDRIGSSNSVNLSTVGKMESLESVKQHNGGSVDQNSLVAYSSSLVSYSDESEEEE